MNRRRTYRPFSQRPHTYGVRVCSCAAFATEPCRPTACISVTQSPSVHCSLITAHWSYTFSAKEKDSETGLSYFGSRYYSSDLSIWLSVDPMASKYPSWSPYVYCANNPVRLVDPDGEEIVITETNDEKGNRVVNISFTAALILAGFLLSPRKPDAPSSITS